jgi:transposase InsO family protein
MCELVEVPRSSFYAWVNRSPSARAVADGELFEQIREIHVRSRRTYGSPRVQGQLARLGVRVSRWRVARLMADKGLVGAHARKRWRRGCPDTGGAPDRLNRNFVVAAPNVAWVADVTEFATGDGKLYLAAIRDLSYRGIVGWDTSGRQNSILVVNALPMALARTGRPIEVIHHSDKGSIYTSLDFAFNAGNADVSLVVRIDRRLLRQRRYGDVLGPAKGRDRMDPRQHLVRDSSRRARLPVRVHRGVLQPSTPPDRTRSPNRNRIR